MNQEQDNRESEKTVDEGTTTQADNAPSDGEFKLTVRKLEMPVRPRGVLAE
jgi:hypothetical protein